MLRYATFLSAFDYEVVSKNGINILDADCLSRAPVVQKELSSDLAINSEVSCLCMASVKEISTEWLNADAVMKATDSTGQLSKAKREIYKTVKSSPMSTP